MGVVLYVKCPLLLSNFNQNWNVLTNFSKTPHVRFHKNAFNHPQVVTCKVTTIRTLFKFSRRCAYKNVWYEGNFKVIQKVFTIYITDNKCLSASGVFKVGVEWDKG